MIFRGAYGKSETKFVLSILFHKCGFSVSVRALEDHAPPQIQNDLIQLHPRMKVFKGISQISGSVDTTTTVDWSGPSLSGLGTVLVQKRHCFVNCGGNLVGRVRVFLGMGAKMLNMK